jgi:hypothetical protein
MPHMPRALADPEAHALAVARAENDRQIKTLETKYRGEIEALRRELNAACTALQDAQATNNRLVRQLQASDETFRKELGIVHAALKDSQAENERMRRRLKHVRKEFLKTEFYGASNGLSFIMALNQSKGLSWSDIVEASPFAILHRILCTPQQVQK